MRSLDDIRADEGRGDPVFHLRNPSIFDPIIGAVAGFFNRADEDEDFETAAKREARRQQEAEDQIVHAVEFLSLRVPAEDMGLSPTTPACLKTYVRSITTRLSEGLGRPYTAHLLDCDAPNAFSLGPNAVGVCRNFALSFETDDELAFVLAHEMAHGALYHNDVLISAEAELRARNTSYALGTAGVIVVSGVGIYGGVQEPVKKFTDEMERTFGISPEEDQDNDLDSVITGLATAGAGVTGAVLVWPFASAVSEAMFVGWAADLQATKSRQELDADKVGLELVVRAGYSPQAAPFVLSQVWGDDSGGSGRAFNGGIASDKTTERDSFSFAGIHPSIEQRLQAVSGVSIDGATPTPSTIGEFCSDEVSLEFRNFVAGLSALSRLADRVLAQPEADFDEYCEAAATFIEAHKEAYLGDQKLAVETMRTAVLCGAPADPALVYAPYASGVAGSIDYMSQLAAFQAWMGDSHGAYGVLRRLQKRSGESIHGFRSITPTLAAMGLNELVAPAVTTCRQRASQLAAVRDTNICRLPDHARIETVLGSGLTWEQIGILMLDSKFVPQDISLPSVSRIKANRYAVQKQVDSMDSEASSFCSSYDPNGQGWITINPDAAPIIDWMAGGDGCLSYAWRKRALVEADEARRLAGFGLENFRIRATQLASAELDHLPASLDFTSSAAAGR